MSEARELSGYLFEYLRGHYGPIPVSLAEINLPVPTATRRAEVEALAGKLFIAMWADYPLTQQCDGSFPDDWDVAAWSFNGAEAWLAERDRRREEAP